MDSVPTKLKNNGFVEPFEMLTKMYGLSNYRELDPTILVMPFFFIFFGMMVADFGYGILLAVLSAIPLKLLNLNRSQKNTVKLVHILSWSITLWGLIYGSFFGFTMPFQLIDINNDITVVIILKDIVYVLIQEDGEEFEGTLMQKWPVRKGRPFKKKLNPNEPLVTGQRVIDTFFPVAEGGSAAVRGPFGAGKTVVQHQIAKLSNVDIVVCVG